MSKLTPGNKFLAMVVTRVKRDERSIYGSPKERRIWGLYERGLVTGLVIGGTVGVTIGAVTMGLVLGGFR
jgi:hypothetical protein